MSETTNNTGGTVGETSGSATAAVAAFVEELRARVSDPSAGRIGRWLAPAVGRLTDQLVIVACDRLARGDMTSFYEVMLDGLSERERATWREALVDDWFRAATERWAEAERLRKALIEAILAVRAAAV